MAEHKIRQTKALIPAKIVWIIGTLFTGILTVGTVLDLQNGINADSVCSIVKMLFYLAAFVLGLLALFKPEKERLARSAAALYAAAAVLGFASDLCGGSRYAALDMTHMIVNVIVMLLFAVTIAVFLKGTASRAFSGFAKLWWVPSAVSMIIAFAQSIVTELNDSHGFDASLVVMDIAAAALYLLPMVLMTVCVEKRKK